jgi:hypothetical protein
MSTTERVRLWDFEVTGRGPFPIDMLRYDACWPVRGEDVMRIEPGPQSHQGTRTVRLVRCARSGNGPTVGRWGSFGWTVTSVDGEPLYD